MKKFPVPVFMYHSVGIVNEKWQWKELTIPVDNFEDQLVFLKANGYHTIHLDELYESIFNNKAIPRKSLILTFDDGYADNYSYLFPLLKKYGFKGTIFVNPEFVDDDNRYNEIKRKSNICESDESIGFLSWAEMREMESTGVIDIQSHALTHTWYPVSEKIIDFRHPGDNYIWMTWNNNPMLKHKLQFDKPDLVELGEPVYENAKSLQAVRFFPDDNLKKHLTEFVKNNGGARFFENSDWRGVLIQQVENFKSSNKLYSCFETVDERFRRIKYELETSKSILERNLNKKIEFLCWPGGSGTEEGVKIALEVGYKMTTAARDIPNSIRKKIKNDGKLMPDRIARTSPILSQKKKNGFIEPIFCNGFGMYLRIKAFNTYGNIQRFYKIMIQLYGYFKSIS